MTSYFQDGGLAATTYVRPALVAAYAAASAASASDRGMRVMNNISALASIDAVTLEWFNEAEIASHAAAAAATVVANGDGISVSSVDCVYLHLPVDLTCPSSY